jgi:hypothetical protein
MPRQAGGGACRKGTRSASRPPYEMKSAQRPSRRPSIIESDEQVNVMARLASRFQPA